MRRMPPRKPAASAASPSPASPPERAPRERLLLQGARLFAERGFDAVSTREICAAAQLNPGAIHYHFGDKDGLYLEVLRQPVQQLALQLSGFDDPKLSLRAALRRYLAPFMQLGDDVQERMALRLYLRELLDPSEMFNDAVRQHFGPQHHGFAAVLARHAGADQPDAAIHQLCYGLVAMAQDYCLSRPLFDVITPGFLGGPEVNEQLLERLVDWGEALVRRERSLRRRQPGR
jgi:AcrR family transcriptional regulator